MIPDGLDLDLAKLAERAQCVLAEVRTARVATPSGDPDRAKLRAIGRRLDRAVAEILLAVIRAEGV